MTTTRHFQSTDSGAPALSGTAGSGIGWLKACLVGVGGVAYGSGASEKLAAGWSVAFEDIPNNICVFRNAIAAGGTGCYLRVDDNGTGSGGTREMLVRLYSSMSDVNTGTDQTPTVAAQAASVVWRKSISTDSTARSWILVADEKTVTLNVFPGHNFGGADVGYIIGHAGDYLSNDPAQPSPCVIAGASAQSSSTTYGPGSWGPTFYQGAAGTVPGDMWVMRGVDYTAAPKKSAIALALNPVSGGGTGSSGAQIADPSPGGGFTFFMPSLLFSESTIIGSLRGLFSPVSNVSARPIGQLYPSAFGRPIGSNLVLLLTTTSATTATTSRSYVAAEYSLEWP